MVYVWIVLGAVVIALPWLLAGRRARRVTVGDVMVRDVVSVEAGASLREAAERMREAGVGVLPVVEGGVVRGILTDRDLVVRALAQGLDPRAMRTADCMSEPVVGARPEWTVDWARQVMARSRVGRLPVMDADDHLLGIVTLGSLALRTVDGPATLEAAREVSRRSARGGPPGTYRPRRA
jgi:CBS domain-containing protein